LLASRDGEPRSGARPFRLRVRSTTGPDDANNIDSRGFVYLRLNRLDEAIADYDAAIRLDAKQVGSLCGRGLARHKNGDQAGGDADIASAAAINASIASEYAKYGMVKSR
jgi:tetratricopeptide (TPR) repeat protein